MLQDEVASEAMLSSSGLLSSWLRDKCNTRPDVDANMEDWLAGQPGSYFPLVCPHCNMSVERFQMHQPLCDKAVYDVVLLPLA